MRAEIISVGTELLLGQIVDTNAAYLSRLLPEFGIDLHYRVTVGDNASRLADALKTALERADIVFTIGGLGPTQDDLTKETIAEVVGDEMVLDEDSARHMREFFAARGIEMPRTNLKQAMAPTRGRALPNPLGTAPGAAFETEDSKIVIALPGPPREFIPMVQEPVTAYLRERCGTAAEVIRSRVLRIAGLGESSVEESVKHLLSGANPTVAPLASPGEVHLRITAKASSIQDADGMIDKMDCELVSVLGNAVFGRDGQTLESVVVEQLIERGLTLGIAESCTGGLISDRITNVPGCSATLALGVVSYSNDAKIKLLGVPEQLLIDHGAVSEEIACAMAEGVRRAAGADVGISTTGIAGPSGGTPQKPVGLVYMALAFGDRVGFGIDRDGFGTEVPKHRASVLVRKHQLMGSRKDIKLRASQAALDMLRTSL